MNRKDFLTNKPDEAFEKQVEAVNKPIQKMWRNPKNPNETISLTESLAEGGMPFGRVTEINGPQRAQATPGLSYGNSIINEMRGVTRQEILEAMGQTSIRPIAENDARDQYRRLMDEVAERQESIRRMNSAAAQDRNYAAESMFSRRSDNLAARDEYQTTSTTEPPLQRDRPTENVITRMYRRLMG